VKGGDEGNVERASVKEVKRVRKVVKLTWELKKGVSYGFPAKLGGVKKDRDHLCGAKGGSFIERRLRDGGKEDCPSPGDRLVLGGVVVSNALAAVKKNYRWGRWKTTCLGLGGRKRTTPDKKYAAHHEKMERLENFL